jgi:predicted acylesterase/phospholipase RssA
MISVAIQGGAMRSIYCLGAVRALVDNGYAQRVQTVHTASAGCVSGLVLAAQMTAPTGPDVAEMRDRFLDKLAGSQFINLRRIRKIVDVDYLAHTIRNVTALSAKALASRDHVFEVGLTDARTGSARYIDLAKLRSDVELERALRATMAIPALYPERIMIDGRRYIDGGISDPLPVLRALRRNPTVLVAISSVATSHLGRELEGPEPQIVRFLPGLLSQPVKHLLLTRNPLGAASEALTEQRLVGGVHMVRIAPASQRQVGHRLETDRDRLLALERLGYQDGCRALTALNHQLDRCDAPQDPLDHEVRAIESRRS